MIGCSFFPFPWYQSGRPKPSTSHCHSPSSVLKFIREPKIWLSDMCKGLTNILSYPTYWLKIFVGCSYSFSFLMIDIPPKTSFTRFEIQWVRSSSLYPFPLKYQAFVSGMICTCDVHLTQIFMHCTLTTRPSPLIFFPKFIIFWSC